MKVDEAAFTRLLEVLGPDRDRAAERYEELRRGLTRFFEWRRSADPVSLVDEVMDRVARRLADGEEIRGAEPAGYFYGVARNVWRESVKRERRERTAISEVRPDATAAAREPDDVDRETERALACLEQCLGTLPVESRGVLLQYYQDRGIMRIERRRRLAEELAIAAGTLRIRMLRIRDRLETCVNTCVARGGVTDSKGLTPINGSRDS